ncbi:hypothetical protein GOY17_08235 [Lysobacter soli]|uniref:hypothetical protein n=1 Tax=Lysobacter soli TaxID=453783 RepID=UPI0012ED64BD|nr:hypothetical protein [Lysobacter soli]QGW64905.1 hypothetical protein GOY17_08235 [Lysobacter soli]
MERLGGLLLVAAPFLAAGAIGLIFPRAWQRVLGAGIGSAAAFAGYMYFTQRDFARHFAGSTLRVADPMTTALETALIAFPIGLSVGLTLHLIASFIRNKEP